MHGLRVLRRLLLGCGVMLVLACLPLRAQIPVSPAIRVLDRFENLEPWKAAASDGVDASLRSAQGVEGPALRLDFDLRGTAGYALAARALPLDLPANFEIAF